MLHLIMQAYSKAMLTGDPDLVELALWLTQSDNLHMLQVNGDLDVEASAHFIPQEWRALGSDRIALEKQQVYKNFVSALNSCMN